jgi:hypothetical protein
MKKARVLERLEERWREFGESLEGLSEGELTREAIVGEWTARDLMAHVTTWEEETLKLLPEILAGRRTPKYSTLYGGVDAFNAQSHERKRRLGLEEVRQQMEETHGRLVGYLESVAEEVFEGNGRFVRRLRLDTYGHYREHAEQVREWRSGRSV